MDKLLIVVTAIAIIEVIIATVSYFKSPKGKLQRLAHHISQRRYDLSDSEIDRQVIKAIDEESASDTDLETKIYIYQEKIKLLREKLARTSSKYTDLIRSLTEENQILWDQKLRDSEELIKLKQAMVEEEE